MLAPFTEALIEAKVEMREGIAGTDYMICEITPTLHDQHFLKVQSFHFYTVIKLAFCFRAVLIKTALYQIQ